MVEVVVTTPPSLISLQTLTFHSNPSVTFCLPFSRITDNTHTMNVTASLHGLSLLEWPAELRLPLYNQLILRCLHDGAASDISGLFLCCRTVYQEMTAEYIRTLKPLLLAKHQWDTSELSDLGCLRVEPQTDLHLDLHLSRVHVAIPVDTAGAIQDDMGLSTGSCFDSLADALQPILTSPWSEITLSFVEQTTEVSRQSMNAYTFVAVFEEFAAPRMQRLTLRFGEEVSRNSCYVSPVLEMLGIVQFGRDGPRSRSRSFDRAYLFMLSTESHVE